MRVHIFTHTPNLTQFSALPSVLTAVNICFIHSSPPSVPFSSTLANFNRFCRSYRRSPTTYVFSVSHLKCQETLFIWQLFSFLISVFFFFSFFRFFYCCFALAPYLLDQSVAYVSRYTQFLLKVKKIEMPIKTLEC